jgi:hypothetical protein
LFCRGVTLKFLALSEERRYRMFENTVLRRIFGLKREEASGR